MSDINVNKLSEALNTKADIDLNNTGVFSTSGGGGVNLTSSTPANASGKEVTSADFIKSNLLNYTTNGILEIPQDIKLELNNGTLTLKAGSKVYVPNGAGVFDVVTIASDINYTYTFESPSDLSIMLFINQSGTEFVYSRFENACFSGETQPSGSYINWYKTNENRMYSIGNNATIDGSGFSLPIAKIIQGSDGVTKSIDQIFNGFGYIGSTAFALPGVKVLIPNGRNADGTLKNIEFVINNVITRTITWNNSSGQELFIGKYNLNEGIQFISTGRVGQYYKQENEPSLIRYAIWYKPVENKVYRCDLDSNGNLIWKDSFPCYIGQWFTSATSPYPITKLTIRLPFHAVDWNDSSWLSGLGMPSNRYIDLTLGASGSTYTAPANGYVYLEMIGTQAQQNGYINSKSNFHGTYYGEYTPNNGRFGTSIIYPAIKGEVFTVVYSYTEPVLFKFFYAQGEQ